MEVTTLSFSPEEPEAFRQREALIAAANADDALAQTRLGDRYRTGDEFTERDYVEALRWYRVAAEQGDPNAQDNLGSMYLNGIGVPKDYAEAAKWYRKAAEQGLAVAQFNLALRYLHGNGVEQDDGEAALWLLRATARGYTEAIAQLGTLCRFGRGVPQDLVSAAELHVLAAAAGDPVALGNLSHYLDELQQLALGGDPSASLSLATIYERGLAVEKDQARALAWLRCRACCTQDADDHVREELEKMESSTPRRLQPLWNRGPRTCLRK